MIRQVCGFLVVQVAFINKIKTFHLVTSPPCIDRKLRRLRLTKMPQFSAGCRICVHVPPSGCHKNNFQGACVPGSCFCYLAEYSSSQHSAREGPSLMHYSGTSVIIWFRGALLCAVSLGFGDEGVSRRCAKRRFMHAGVHLKPGAALHGDKAPSSPTHSSNPSQAKHNTR